MPANSYDAVLLIGFGGPTRPQEVRPYLANVLRGRPVPPDRIDEVAHNYEAIGGKSPFNELTFRQAKGLRELLRREGPDLPVYVGMRHWHPLLVETLEQMVRDGVKSALAIILAPHQGEASWGRYQVALKQAQLEVQSKLGGCPLIEYCQPWFRHPLFIEAAADKLRCKMSEIHFDQMQSSKLLFSAHSVPAALAQPYQAQLLETCAAVAGNVGVEGWELVYQSRSGNPHDPWLQPDVCDAISRLGGEGCKNVLLAPVGFVCDHVEILFDLDVKARRVAEERGMGFYRAGTVGDHPSFIRMLADLVREAQEGRIST
ncbi:MAG: ferrochelatase [Acidobacteria bacterium]|nr:MAG: ferrochelatase [Acidobacteriota bacterium]